MPSFFTDGTMDPKLLKIYVLVHDLQHGPVDGYIPLRISRHSSTIIGGKQYAHH
jgi:hypothetical protein